MGKILQTSEQIINTLNATMAESDALDGDCRECLVRRICRVTEQEAEQLGRNWNRRSGSGQANT